MIQDIQKLLDDYTAWLRDKTSLREVADWVEITTPYLDRHNDYIQIYAKKANGSFVLTDDGYTIGDLEQNGCKLNSPKRQDLLKMTLNGFGVQLHGDALEVLRRIPDGSLSFLYLLHPDPWPKARHAKRRMMNDGPVDLFAAKLKAGGEFRFGTDHPVYVRHALMVMRRHRHQFDWLIEGPEDFQQRPGGWPETRYEHKARTVYGHEVWYFRFRKKSVTALG